MSVLRLWHGHTPIGDLWSGEAIFARAGGARGGVSRAACGWGGRVRVAGGVWGG